MKKLTYNSVIEKIKNFDNAPEIIEKLKKIEQEDEVSMESLIRINFAYELFSQGSKLQKCYLIYLYEKGCELNGFYDELRTYAIPIKELEKRLLSDVEFMKFLKNIGVLSDE